MIDVCRYYINEEVTSLLRDIGVTKLPINMTHVCGCLGIEIRYDSRLKEIDSYYLSSSHNHGTLIVVNDNKPLSRQRFSAGHELGHIVREHDQRVLSRRGMLRYIREPQYEREANVFASELLMPEFLLRQYGYLHPKQIACICGVSLQTAVIRAEELGWVIRDNRGKIRYIHVKEEAEDRCMGL